MKNGTLYSKRVRKHFAKVKPLGAKDPAPREDALEILCAAILGEGTGLDAGRRALEALFTHIVDWNEMRVCSPEDLARYVGRSIPEAAQRCATVRRVLNDVFHNENRMSLERLRSWKLRDARAYLTALDGVGGFATACVVLWSLGGHAIPVDQTMMAYLRKHELVDAEASRPVVQAFLERAIPAARARGFCDAIRRMIRDDPSPATSRTRRKTAAPARRKTGGTARRKTGGTARRKRATPARRKTASTERARKKVPAETKKRTGAGGSRRRAG